MLSRCGYSVVGRGSAIRKRAKALPQRRIDGRAQGVIRPARVIGVRGDPSDAEGARPFGDASLERKKANASFGCIRSCPSGEAAGALFPRRVLAFLSEQPRTVGGELSVGLLTDVFRRGHPRQRIPAAFPAKPLQPPVTCFRRKRIYFTITAMELHVAAAFAAVPAAKHVQEFHLIPLFSRTRMRVRPGVPERVAHLPQKPDIPYAVVWVSYDRGKSCVGVTHA